MFSRSVTCLPHVRVVCESLNISRMKAFVILQTLYGNLMFNATGSPYGVKYRNLFFFRSKFLTKMMSHEELLGN